MKGSSNREMRMLLAATVFALTAVLAVQCLFWTGLLPKSRVEKAQAEDPAVYAAEGSLSRDGY